MYLWVVRLRGAPHRPTDPNHGPTQHTQLMDTHIIPRSWTHIYNIKYKPKVDLYLPVGGLTRESTRWTHTSQSWTHKTPSNHGHIPKQWIHAQHIQIMDTHIKPVRTILHINTRGIQSTFSTCGWLGSGEHTMDPKTQIMDSHNTHIQHTQTHTTPKAWTHVFYLWVVRLGRAHERLQRKQRSLDRQRRGPLVFQDILKQFTA